MEKYRNLYHVTVEYRKQVKAWSITRNGDTEGYQRFCNFSLKCESIAESAQWNQLDTYDIICMLLAKLSDHTRDKWVWHVLRIQRKQSRESGLLHFVEFVKDETLLVNDPLFPKSATDQRSQKRSQKAHNKILSTKETS